MPRLANRADRPVHCFILPSHLAPEIAMFAARHLDGACRIDARRPELVIVRLRRKVDAMFFRIFFAEDVLREFRILSGQRWSPKAGALFAGDRS